MTDDLPMLHGISLIVFLGAGLATLLFSTTLPLRARLGIAVLPPLVSIMVWNWWISLVIRPFVSDWSGPRLAPALALVHGYKLYHPPESGPVSGWIYPPISALLYLPATLFGDPTAMVLAGRVLSLLFYFGPVCWLLIREARGGRIPPVADGLLFVSFAFLTNSTAALRYVSTEVIADTPALGFGVLAMSWVGLMRGASPRRRATLAIAASTMAAWSKQLAVPLLLIPMLWAGGTGGWKGLVRCMLLSAVVVGGISIPLVLAFGPSELFFNTIVVPSHHPWCEVTYSGIWRVVLEKLGNARSLAAFLGLASAGVLLYNRSDSRQATCGSPLIWLPFFLAGLFEVPLSVVGTVKLGGDSNSLSHVLCYWTVAAVLALGRVSTQRASAGWLVLGIAVALGVSDDRKISSLIVDLSPSWTDESSRGMNWIEEQKMVVRYLKTHPGEAYFPCRPLEHMVVEGQPSHFEYGIYDRKLAGVPLSSDHVRRHIPPETIRLCYPTGRPYTTYSAVQSLPEFDRRVLVDELPGCVCFQRSVPAHASPKNASGPMATALPVAR